MEDGSGDDMHVILSRTPRLQLPLYRAPLLGLASLGCLAGPRRGALSALGTQPWSSVRSRVSVLMLFMPSFLEPSLLFLGWKSKAPYANPAMPVNHFQLAPSE